MTRRAAASRGVSVGTSRGTSPNLVREPHRISQPHGGALLSGGRPGNRGGTGRPPSAMRALLSASFEQRIRILEMIADDRLARVGDRLRAIDILGKYGLRGDDGTIDVQQVRTMLENTYRLLVEALDPATFARISRRMKVIWTKQRRRNGKA
jgi:hypothetical protein